MVHQIISSKLLLFLLLYVATSQFSFSQERQDCIPVYKIQYADTTYMKRHVNGEFWVLKEGVKDGKWITFYDTEHKDTAMVANVNGGLVNGWVKRWDI